MADNVIVQEAVSGSAIAADEVTRNATSEKQQIIKIALGAEGAFDNLVDAGQQTRSASVPVALSTEDTALIDGIEGSLTTLASAVRTEDAAETAATGMMVVGSVRRDTAASSAGTSGDNATINTDSIGALWTRDTATQVDDAAFTPATGRIIPVGLLADETSTDSVDEGDAGIPRMTLDRKQIVTPEAHTNGGATPYKLVSAASTNATSLKASAGQIYSISAFNINGAVRYLKLYNKASAPTVGTDVPVHVYAIPGATTGGGFTLSIPVGMEFTTGIAFAITTGITDADTGAVAASEILVNIDYK